MHPWGEAPWPVPVTIPSVPLPGRAGVAVVGAGLTGLSAACHLARRGLRVIVLESSIVGEGASGRSGGVALEDTAAGPVPGFENCLEELKGFDCELDLGGCWEVSHTGDAPARPLDWQDSRKPLRVTGRVPGGLVHPGKLLAGVARRALEAGVTVHQHSPVTGLEFSHPLRLRLPGRKLAADCVVLATNGYAFELSALQDLAAALLTTALATEPLEEEQIAAAGLAERRPFYTSDLPYLWGRLTRDSRLIVGSGLVDLDHPRGAEKRFRSLERRLRGLHPALGGVRVSHRWMGLICIPADFRPILRVHPRSERVFFGGGYAGHGLAQSLRMGRLLAEAITSRPG